MMTKKSAQERRRIRNRMIPERCAGIADQKAAVEYMLKGIARSPENLPFLKASRISPPIVVSETLAKI